MSEGRAFQSLGAELEKEKALNRKSAFGYGPHLHLECKGKAEKMINEIVVTHSKKSFLKTVHNFL